MVQLDNHQRLMHALEEARSEPRLPSRLELARRAGVSPATMNRDRQFLDAFADATDSGRRAAEPCIRTDNEQVQRLRQEKNHLEAAVQLLAESVQALTLENERLTAELRRRHDLAPVDMNDPQPGDTTIRRPRR